MEASEHDREDAGSQGGGGDSQGGGGDSEGGGGDSEGGGAESQGGGGESQGGGGESQGGGRRESEKERLDRNLQELLGELRVALPGVQVLFAFLLVVPFNQRFADITSFQRTVYFVTLLLATAASACLIAPTAHHRIEFRAQDKKRIVFAATKLAVVGLALLAAAMTGAVMLITDFLYHATTVAIVASAVALLFAALWFAWPVKRLLDHR